MSNNKILKYDESSIQILNELEAVRKRPGMYIGSTDINGLHHLVWEIIDNSIDEVLAGYCTEINITIHLNNAITIKDNGRGIPIGKHISGKSTPEIIFSILHTGSKFNNNSYEISGGLHGVGSSIVNALSTEFIATIYRDNKISQIKFINGGKLVDNLQIIGNTNKTGTEIYFLPDTKIFKIVNFSFSMISERIRESAFINKGLKINLLDKRNNNFIEYLFNNGLKDFIKHINQEKNIITPIIYFKGKEKNIEVEIVLQYISEFNENLLSFANNVKTNEGGTHITGFRLGLNKVINEYAKKSNLLKDKDKHFDWIDIREGLTAIISVKIPENLIQYEGQIKSKLATNEAKLVVENILNKQFYFWMQENKLMAYKIIEKIITAKFIRTETKKKQENIRKYKYKINHKKDRILIGKLTLAQNKYKKNNELFLVEGESAGGSAKSGRDRKFQAILTLRGKVINAEKAKLQDLMNNEEINILINAIGTGVGPSFNIKNINYGKIIIMTDADTDGAHIQILLLTFFYRFMRPLIDNKLIYIALPPLFKIKNKKNQIIQYAWNELQMKTIINNNIENKYEIQRYKGLGEMNAEQLWDTTMNPETRQLINIIIDDNIITEKKIIILMGEDAKKRKKWIDQNIKFTLEDNYNLNKI